MRCSKRNGDLVLINPYWVREITTLDEGEPAYMVRYHDGSEQIVFQLPVDAAAEWAAAMHGDPAAEPVAEPEPASEGNAPDGLPKVRVRIWGDRWNQFHEVIHSMVRDGSPERNAAIAADAVVWPYSCWEQFVNAWAVWVE